MSRLGLSIFEEKTAAISALAFPKNLKDLESGLGFIGYYRAFIHHFAGIANPLNKLKRIGFKGALMQKRERDHYATSFKFPPIAEAVPDDVTLERRLAAEAERQTTQQYLSDL